MRGEKSLYSKISPFYNSFFSTGTGFISLFNVQIKSLRFFYLSILDLITFVAWINLLIVWKTDRWSFSETSQKTQKLKALQNWRFYSFWGHKGENNVFQKVQRSKLFTLLVAFALWEVKEKGSSFCLSVTIGIATSLRFVFFSKIHFAEILVLFHSSPQLLFSESWKNPKNPTHLTFSRKKSFFESFAVSRNLCSLFPFAFSQIAEISVFFPFKNFLVSMNFFSYHS